MADMSSPSSPVDACTQTTLKRPQKRRDGDAAGGSDSLQDGVMLSVSSTQAIGTDVSHVV